MKPISETDLEQLSAYIDGELHGSERRFFEKRLTADPALLLGSRRARAGRHRWRHRLHTADQGRAPTRSDRRAVLRWRDRQAVQRGRVRAMGRQLTVAER